MKGGLKLMSCGSEFFCIFAGVMLDKLEAIYARYQEIEQQMNDPQVTADMKRYVKLSKDYKDLQPIVKAYQEYKSLLDSIAECRELLDTEKDAELREMAKEEDRKSVV